MLPSSPSSAGEFESLDDSYPDPSYRLAAVLPVKCIDFSTLCSVHVAVDAAAVTLVAYLNNGKQSQLAAEGVQ